MSKLGKTIGPNALLKVMAGDELSATTQYYYQNAVVNQAGNNLTTHVLSALIHALSGSNADMLVKGSTADISADLTGSASFTNKTSPDANNASGNNAKAYLNVLFFDERFNFVEEGSTSLRVSEAGSSNASLTLANIKTPKNGYAYIYLSNESNEVVYFDNFQVSHTRGRIIEENHYYAFGLKIAGISSRKLGEENEGHLKNNNQFQGEFNEFDEDIGWNGFALRDYDPQVGRFVQADPFAQFPSQYTGMGNDPINLIDPSGGLGIPCPGAPGLGMLLQKVGQTVANGLSAASAVSNIVSLSAQAASFGIGVYDRSVQSNLVNNQIGGNVTKQVGKDRVFGAGSEYENGYDSPDLAAAAWSQKVGQWSMDENVELSSNIYEMKGKKGKKYNFTDPSMDDDGTKRAYNSPGPKQINKPMPQGASVVGHIHSHVVFRDHWDLIFSKKNKPTDIAYRYDQDMHATMSKLSFYLLNGNGELWVRRGEGVTLQGFSIDQEIRFLGNGLPWDRLDKELKKYNERIKYKRPPKFEPNKAEFQYKPDRI